MGEVDLLTAPHRQLAAVEIDVAQLGHEIHDPLEQYAIVVHGDMVETDPVVGKIALGIVEIEKIGNVQRRECGAQSGNAVPVQPGALGAEVDVPERREK